MQPAFLFGRRPCVVWWVLGDSQARGTMVTILKPPFFTGLDLGSPLLRERGSGFFNVSEPPPRYGTLQNPQGHDLAKGLCTANQRSSPTTGPNHLEECGATELSEDTMLTICESILSFRHQASQLTSAARARDQQHIKAPIVWKIYVCPSGLWLFD